MTKKLVIFRQEGISNVRKQDISQNGIQFLWISFYNIVCFSHNFSYPVKATSQFPKEQISVILVIENA